MTIEEKLSKLELFDMAILSHGFAAHMRDYEILLESATHEEGMGTFMITFTHCFDLSYQTVFDKQLLQRSWEDRLLDYEQCKDDKELPGYLWGVNWVLSYPGFELIKDSIKAKDWSQKLKKEMHEMEVETNVFKLNFIFHDFKYKKIGEGTPVTNAVTIPVEDFKYRED